jgi:NADH dehydrogenase FAD-containing subunit
MPEHLPRVVIVGGGFGGLAAASECKEGLMPRSVVVKPEPDSLARRTEI